MHWKRGWISVALVLAALAAWLGDSGWGAPGAAGPAPDGLIASPEPGWPQWRGPRRDGISLERGLLAEWTTEGPRLLWKVEALGRGWSSPIIVNGTLYVTGDLGDDLVIHALNLDGTPKWRAKNGAAWKGQYPGARACPAYSEGRLYHLNAHGRLACLDAATGAERWAVDVLERFGAKNITWALSENLLVDGPRVIVSPGGPRAMVAALDKKDGRTLWATPPPADDESAYSSPILFRWSGRRILAGLSSKHGWGIDADTGRLLWSVPVESRFHATVATPIYGEGCVFYVAPDGPDGTLFRLRPEGEGVQAEQAWHSSILDSLCGSGVVVDGFLYASGYRKTKTWHCLNWQTGEHVYELKELTTGAAIWAEGRLYCFAEEGTLALLKPVPNGLELAGRLKVTEARRDAWAHPVLLDGRLYVRYHDALWCYDVKRDA